MISEAQILSCLEQLMPIKNRANHPPLAIVDIELGFVAQAASSMLKTTAIGQELHLCLQLIVWDRQPRSIRDIKEQEVLIATIPVGMPFERVADFIKGWTLALEEVMSLHAGMFEFLMPCDLVCPDALWLLKPKNEQDFKEACLTKNRLGRWRA